MMATLWVIVYSVVQLLLFVVNHGQSSSPPNIILIISDDLGYDDLGFKNNHQVLSPHINKLVSEGQFIKWHYAMSICSPTRATLLTGRYTLRTGINNVIFCDDAYGLPINETLLPQILKSKANYKTHAVGKWHLGFYKVEYTPTWRGFDTFYGYYSGGEDYFTHRSPDTQSKDKPPPVYYDFRYDNKPNCDMNCSQVQVNALNEYSTYLFNERAVDIINNHKKTSPLFLYLAYQAVHAPTEVPIKYQNMYINTINNTLRQKFAGMISCMDDSINNITNALTKGGYLSDTGNTVIIFLSDNGGPIPGDPDPAAAHQVTGSCNAPLRGGKHTLWEGGTRTVASIWSTPDININANSGNYTKLFHVADWMPTILEAAGINYKDLGIEFDGVSHWNSFLDKDNNDTIRNIIWYGWKCCTDSCNETGIGYQGWKLLNTSGGPPNQWYTLQNASNIYDDDNNSSNSIYPLYNLFTDAGEHNDLSDQYPEKVQQMLAILTNLTSNGVPQVTNDPNCPSKVNPFVPGVGQTLAPWC